MSQRITKKELNEATKLGPFCAARFLADGKRVVKTSDLTRLTEANTMRYIRENTSIPVPEVLDAYTDEETGHVRIVMERIEGDSLEKSWDLYGEEEKEVVAQQLRSYFDELRQIKGTFIGSIDGSACDDQYFSDGISGFGPYATEADFNVGITSAWSKGREHDPFTQLLCRTQRQVMTGHDIVLTYNNFAPRNILVRGTEVVAILDWKFAGFYPEYWEYCKALWRPGWDNGWSKDGLVDKVLDPYLQEESVLLNTAYALW